jgi:hypothetical protein
MMQCSQNLSFFLFGEGGLGVPVDRQSPHLGTRLSGFLRCMLYL